MRPAADAGDRPCILSLLPQATTEDGETLTDQGLRDGLPTPVRAGHETAANSLAWAWERPDGGRSFGFSGLHFHDNWKREEYRRLVSQGVLWSLGLPVPEKGLAVELAESDYALPKK